VRKKKFSPVKKDDKSTGEKGEHFAGENARNSTGQN